MAAGSAVKKLTDSKLGKSFLVAGLFLLVASAQGFGKLAHIASLGTEVSSEGSLSFGNDLAEI